MHQNTSLTELRSKSSFVLQCVSNINYKVIILYTQHSYLQYWLALFLYFAFLDVKYSPTKITRSVLVSLVKSIVTTIIEERVQILKFRLLSRQFNGNLILKLMKLIMFSLLWYCNK